MQLHESHPAVLANPALFLGATQFGKRRAKSSGLFVKKASGAELQQLKRAVSVCWDRAATWRSFSKELAKHDLAVAPSGIGAGYVRLSTRRKLAVASDVGPGYRAMILRFGEGMPGHPYPGVAERALAERNEWRAGIAEILKRRRLLAPSAQGCLPLGDI